MVSRGKNEIVRAVTQRAPDRCSEERPPLLPNDPGGVSRDVGRVGTLLRGRSLVLGRRLLIVAYSRCIGSKNVQSALRGLFTGWIINDIANTPQWASHAARRSFLLLELYCAIAEPTVCVSPLLKLSPCCHAEATFAVGHRARPTHPVQRVYDYRLSSGCLA
jgi:hypothetical protein